MNENILKAILVFLQKTTLTPHQIQSFVAVVKAIEDEIKSIEASKEYHSKDAGGGTPIDREKL